MKQLFKDFRKGEKFLLLQNFLNLFFKVLGISCFYSALIAFTLSTKAIKQSRGGYC